MYIDREKERETERDREKETEIDRQVDRQAEPEEKTTFFFCYGSDVFCLVWSTEQVLKRRVVSV